MATPAELKQKAPGQSPTKFNPEVKSASAAPGPIRVAILGVLLLIAFWPILRGMYGSWFDPRLYMDHGVLVAPAAAYIAWTKREKLRAVRPQPSAWGAIFLVWGALQAMLGIAAQWIWVSRTAFLISLVGFIAVLFG